MSAAKRDQLAKEIISLQNEMSERESDKDPDASCGRHQTGRIKLVFRRRHLGSGTARRRIVHTRRCRRIHLQAGKVSSHEFNCRHHRHALDAGHCERERHVVVVEIVI